MFVSTNDFIMKRRQNACAGMGNVSGRFNGCGSVATNSRTRLTEYLRLIGNTVAWYQPSVGVTGTLNASAWANQMGAAVALEQATGANQPIYLPYSGSKYGYLPGVAGNYFSTPKVAANQITGDIAVIAYVALDDWTPAAQADILTRFQNGAGNLSWEFRVAATSGFLAWQWSADGSVAVATQSSSAAPVFSDVAYGYIAISHDVDNGATGNDVKFWTSTDGVIFTQLGTTQTLAGVTSIAAGNANMLLGAWNAGANGNMFGRTKMAALYNGIPPILGGSGSVVPVQQWNASDWSETTTNGATQASSTTGEVWTLNNTAIATPAGLIGSSFIVANELDRWMRATYTANQPRTLYLVGMDPVWAAGKYIADGVTANTLGLSKTTATPSISINAGAAAAENAGFTLRAKHILTIVLNGASSSTAIDAVAAVTGNAGAGNPGGLTIGADGGTPTAGTYGGFWYSEILDRDGEDTATVQATIRNALKQIHHTP